MSTKREKYFEQKLELLSKLTNDLLFVIFIPILIFLIGGSMFAIENNMLLLASLGFCVYMAIKLNKSFKSYRNFMKNNSIPE